MLTDAADPDHQLIALTAAPGAPAHDRLRLLTPRAPPGASYALFTSPPSIR